MEVWAQESQNSHDGALTGGWEGKAYFDTQYPQTQCSWKVSNDYPPGIAGNLPKKPVWVDVWP